MSELVRVKLGGAFCYCHNQYARFVDGKLVNIILPEHVGGNVVFNEVTITDAIRERAERLAMLMRDDVSTTEKVSILEKYGETYRMPTEHDMAPLPVSFHAYHGKVDITGRKVAPGDVLKRAAVSVRRESDAAMHSSLYILVIESQA